MHIDQYLVHVIASYAATVVIIGGVVLATVLSARRARAELEEAERLEIRR
ncbi:MAG: heme exporter protein CcmD [Pseudomonadota bacterium]